MTITPRLLITGGEGRLARAAVPSFVEAGWDVVAPGRAQFDVTDRHAVLRSVRDLRPDAVLNLAARTSMITCEQDPPSAHRVNTLGVRNIVEACDAMGAHLCHLSSDYVFSGDRTEGSYSASDATGPLSVYGATKRAGELELHDDATLVRTAWVSGTHGPNVVHSVLRQASSLDGELAYVDDQRGSPTSADDLVRTLIALISERIPGLFHVTNQGSASWFDIAHLVLETAGHDPGRVRPAKGIEVEPLVAPLRPRYSVLDNAALQKASVPLPPAWEDSFRRLVSQLTAPNYAPMGHT